MFPSPLLFPIPGRFGGCASAPTVSSSAITLAPWEGNGLSPEFWKSGREVLFSRLFLFSPEPISCHVYTRCSIYVCWKNKSLPPKVISSSSHTVMLCLSASFLNFRHLKQVSDFCLPGIRVLSSTSTWRESCLGVDSRSIYFQKINN